MRPESDITNEARYVELLLEFAASKRRNLRFATPESLVDTVSHLFRVVRLADKNFAIKSYLDLIREMQAAEGKPECFEDEFALGVAFLQLEVSKIGAVTYLKGESPDFKMPKRKRTMLDTGEDAVLKKLSSGLARPNEMRGRVEVDMITSAHRRMGKLINLHNTIPEVAKAMQDQWTKETIISTIKVGPLQEKMTLTDYDTIMRMARREKNYVAFKSRTKDPTNAYELSVENHKRVKSVGEMRGVTPRRALNEILDEHFSMLQSRQLLGTPLTPRKD